MQEIDCFILKEEKELSSVAAAIIPLLQNRPWVLLEGELGAGKTALVKQICHLLGYHASSSSPSFGIINEYALEEHNGLLYHLDLYRINQPGELTALGIEEILGSGFPVFIEWPQLLEPFLSEKYIKVEITMAENERIFRIFQKG
jgi:tRNA threonylcarbamoyladenosine biosynthesis protein TsaE